MSDDNITLSKMNRKEEIKAAIIYQRRALGSLAAAALSSSVELTSLRSQELNKRIKEVSDSLIALHEEYVGIKK